ncbi:dTDP-glucose 4,6-dehydratase [Nonlabens ulvanivorans]|uniref:dTDP-glucose 4,6-dehydratase n=2 Tax=Nonlabens ulvanivorans TaxID=906888 RepID=A0A090QA58_NONUL|nr:dTDP-glucose 4,6-dehydratase [Nonlabens ulvanivorans]GAK98658.1 dTDP-glucose 4,6-dehydratase [Nonlabens ulvanivorans]GAL73959.1 dTDP-glucose 4,6-dehydratase [Nonlabens ulvanivorans]
MLKILVTGGAGFIGSNLIEYLLTNTSAHIYNLDKLTYAADLGFAHNFKHDRLTFIEGDICDAVFINKLFEDYQFDKVYHLAAESHVDNSIENPQVFIETNVNGTFNLLHASYQLWMEKPRVFKPDFSTKQQQSRFLHISTDEVYGSLEDDGFFTEKTPYAPSSPYSASKAASDHLVMSYVHTYGFPAVITNCSNNYGPRQHDEKLIPVVIRKALNGESIPIYGDGKNVRDWLYVTDHCQALHTVLEKASQGENYNIGGKNEIRNIDIANHICSILDEVQPRKDGQPYAAQITYVNDRPGHDYRYAIDPSKIEEDFNWQPAETFTTGIKKTVEWYLKKYNA